MTFGKNISDRLTSELDSMKSFFSFSSEDITVSQFLSELENNEDVITDSISYSSKLNEVRATIDLSKNSITSFFVTLSEVYISRVIEYTPEEETLTVEFDVRRIEEAADEEFLEQISAGEYSEEAVAFFGVQLGLFKGVTETSLTERASSRLQVVSVFDLDECNGFDSIDNLCTFLGFSIVGFVCHENTAILVFEFDGSRRFTAETLSQFQGEKLDMHRKYMFKEGALEELPCGHKGEPTLLTYQDINEERFMSFEDVSFEVDEKTVTCKDVRVTEEDSLFCEISNWPEGTEALDVGENTRMFFKHGYRCTQDSQQTYPFCEHDQLADLFPKPLRTKQVKIRVQEREETNEYPVEKQAVFDFLIFDAPFSTKNI